MVDSAEVRKARGAFFTPLALSDYICRWAVRAPTDHILEPSCGEAAFLTAAAHRLDELGVPRDGHPHLFGVELHEHSAAAARALMEQAGRSTEIVTADFFAQPAQRRFDTAPPDLIPADVQPAQFFARMIDKLLNAAPVAHHVRVRERRERRTIPVQEEDAAGDA